MIIVYLMLISSQQWQHNAHPPSDYVVSNPPSRAPIPSRRRSDVAPPLLRQAPIPSGPPPPSPPLPFISSFGGKLYPPPSPGIAISSGKSTITYEELAQATNSFSKDNLIGQGGFGYVYRGILHNGREVAIKKRKPDSGQGECEYQAEVEIISRVHHKHLVSLVGYCSTGSERLLAYEFVPNNTLDHHLHEGKGLPTLNWPRRLQIALGSAKGLAYLHEDCHPNIIHRDIKAANILLDSNFEAKVADFGLAKIVSNLTTPVSTRVMGTHGYISPEYAIYRKLTDKADVYSYGVMLLELISGRKPLDKDDNYMLLVDWAKPLFARAFKEKNIGCLVDRRLKNNYGPKMMTRMAACAAACTRKSAMLRPKMSRVVHVLEGDVSLEDLNAGVTPGDSSVISNQQYREDMAKFEEMLLGTYAESRE